MINRRSLLDKWMVAGPGVSILEDEFERSSGLGHSTTDERHNEDSTKTQKDFFKQL